MPSLTMKWNVLLLSWITCSLLVHSTAQAHRGNDLSQSPPNFIDHGDPVVFVDFEYVDSKVVFDVDARKAVAHTRIEFFSRASGYPLIDLVPEATKVLLNGKTLSQGLKLIETPDGDDKIRMVTGKVSAMSRNVLEITHELPKSEISFNSTGASIGFFMSDLSRRQYLEQYFPTNLEFDSYRMTLHIEMDGATEEHQLFSNGSIQELRKNEWKITFPSYFTTSSFFIHLTQKDVTVKTGTYSGIHRDIPVTIYGESSSKVNTAYTETFKVLKELENTYGEFAHNKLVVYITAGGGGMEYCGATTTSLWALGHELTHSWFARGVMPANGNAGWIDEAIASWRDDGYPKADSAPNRPAVNLGGFSDYRRHTPMEAYDEGAELMSEFDYLFSSGLKPVLRSLFQNYRQKVLTTPLLMSFLEDHTGQNLQGIFKKYVFGKSRSPFPSIIPNVSHWKHFNFKHHPRPYTREELISMR